MTKEEIIEQAEAFVIGTFLSGNDSFATFGAELTETCFVNPQRIELFRAMRGVAEKGDKVDVTTVSRFLQQYGSNITVFDVIEASQRYAVDIEQHIAVLIDNAAKREIEMLGLRLVNAAHSDNEPADNVLATAQTLITSMQEKRVKGVHDGDETYEEVIQMSDDMRRGVSSRRQTHTGFRHLDETGGLHSTDLIIIAGESSMGKTSFSLSVVRNALIERRKIAFFSLEMDRFQVMARMVAMTTKINAREVLDTKLSDYDFERMKRDRTAIDYRNLFFDDKSTSNIDTIISHIRRLKLRNDIDGAVVDYLQILSVNATKSNRSTEGELAEYARRLKNLAKELNIWIIALSQLNRDKENHVPSLSRLRGSGQIAEAADEVIFVYRPEYYGETTYPQRLATSHFDGLPTHNGAWVMRAKGRNTGLAEFVCSFYPTLTMFDDILPNGEKQDGEVEQMPIPKPKPNDMLPF